MSRDIANNNNTQEFKNVKYLLTSSMRTLILVVLYNKRKNLNEIRDELHKPSATILHLLATNVIKLIDNWHSIEKNKIFWNNHDLKGIPENFLNKLYLLKDAELISSTTSDLSNAFNKYIELISSSKELTIILPIYSENHFKHLIKLLKNNQLNSLKLLVNTEILQTMQKSRYLKKSLIENKNVEILETDENIKLFLTYSTDFMALTLFFKDNHYDDSQLIIDNHKSAIKWSEELFNFYCRR